MDERWVLAAAASAAFTVGGCAGDDDGLTGPTPAGGVCVLVEPLPDDGGLWPTPVPGATACPRALPLIDHGWNPPEVLDVGAAMVGQTHCDEVIISFGTEQGFCGDGNSVSLYFIAAGPGRYEVVDEDLECLRGEDGTIIGPPPGQPVFAARAWRPTPDDRFREGWRGTGVVDIQDAYLDQQYTRGSVDVAFPDGTRLLADFVAPLCGTE